MNHVLQSIVENGTIKLPSGEEVNIHSHVGAGSGRVISRAVEVAKPLVACEVGLAFGVSSLYILEAMQKNGFGHLIGMDPAQYDKKWRGGGLHNIDKAGFSNSYEFHEETSQRVLPRLEKAGTRIQFAFIDGWHTFDHTLIDFFYIDQMLDIGGVVVLDDVGYPGLCRLAHFILTNRSYEILDFDPIPQKLSLRSKLKGIAQQILHPLVKDNFSPNSDSRNVEHQVNKAQLIALIKRDYDQRSFDHFVPF